MKKKLALAVVSALAVAVAVFYYVNGRDDYDPSKYSATVTAGQAQSAAAAPNSPGSSSRTQPASVGAGLSPGARVDFTLPDQFGEPHSVTPETKLLIFAFSKAAGGTVKSLLDRRGKEYLSSRGALFIADISSLPTVVRNSVALPMLRDRAYPVVLIYEESLAEALKNEREADKIALATLQRGVVQRVTYVSTEAELEAALD